MDLDELTTTLSAELVRIAPGEPGSLQRHLRTAYVDVRRTGLAANPDQPCEQAFREAVQVIRRDFPKFEPTAADREYFGWEE